MMRVCELKALIANLPDDAFIGAVNRHGYITDLRIRQIMSDNHAQYDDGERQFVGTDYIITSRGNK